VTKFELVPLIHLNLEYRPQLPKDLEQLVKWKMMMMMTVVMMQQKKKGWELVWGWGQGSLVYRLP
jgi:hypothetical protein